MKKETSHKLLLSLILTSFLISILAINVLAEDVVDTEQIRQASATGIKAALAPIMGMAKGVLDVVFGEQWFNLTRVFLFILLTLIIWSIMPLILGEDKKALNFWISLVIATISIIAIPPELLDTLIQNYGAMGAAMLTVIPFALILVFSARVQNALLARVVWIFYCIYYFALYIHKAIETAGTMENIYYGFAIIGGILMFFLIGKIRNLIFFGKMDAIKETGLQIARRGKLLHKVQKEELEQSYSDSAGN
jgi:hypothetical protein